MSLAAPSGVTIHNTIGAVLCGFAAACCFYGILITQVWVYFSRFPSDRAVYKFLVILILLLETADQVFIGHLVYYYGIVNFANPRALLEATVTWSFILQQTVGSTVGMIVKTYFATRVWRFSQRNYFLTGIVLLLTYGQMGLSIAFTVKSFQLPNVFAVAELRLLGTVTLGVGVLTDIVIACAQAYSLSSLKTGYHESDSLVSTLVRYAVNTGALTTAVSTATVTIYNVMPHTLIFVAVFFVLSKMFAISFMATLNTRRIAQGMGTDREATKSNNTNMFHLGTRMPSMGPSELHWDPKDIPMDHYPPFQHVVVDDYADNYAPPPRGPVRPGRLDP
ncbi:hypothetical protein C8J56DRAFT_488570 [Mycena floridula]|nr:hypothetical protein C8J56DRAFT_488570 [Mycena floridula]